MKRVQLELTNKEYDTLMEVFKKMREEPEQQCPRKWIHEGEYLVNTETGARINKITKRRG